MSGGVLGSVTGPFHDNYAINVSKVLKAAPTLKNRPDFVHAAATSQGDVAHNAQAIAGLHLAHTMQGIVDSYNKQNPGLNFAIQAHKKATEDLQNLGVDRGPQPNNKNVNQEPNKQWRPSGGPGINWGTPLTDVGHAAIATQNWANRNFATQQGIHNQINIGVATEKFIHDIPGWAIGANPKDPWNYKNYLNPSKKTGGYGLPALVDDMKNHLQQHIHDTVLNPQWYKDNSAAVQQNYSEARRQQQANHDAQVSGQPAPYPLVAEVPGAGGKFGAIAQSIAPQTEKQLAAATKKSFVQGVMSQFDTWNHFYRYAYLSYKKGGNEGLLNALFPLFAGAAIGTAASFVMGPEGLAIGAEGGLAIGAETATLGTEAGVTGAVGADGLLAGNALATNAARIAASTADTAGSTAGRQGAEKILAGAGEDAPKSPYTKIRITDQQKEVLGANRSKSIAQKVLFLRHPAGATIKGFNQLMNSDALLGANVTPQVFHDNALWEQSRVATKDLSTFGRFLSQELLHKQDSWISGTTDAITSMLEAPMMFGRSLGLEKEGINLAGGRSMEGITGEQFINEYNTSTRISKTFDVIAGFHAKQKLVDITTLDAKGNTIVVKAYDTIGKIIRWAPSLAPIAEELVKAMDAGKEIVANGGSMSIVLRDRVAELADATSMLHSVRLPATGIYGLLRKAKVGDSWAAGQLNKHLGQNAFYYDEATKKILHKEIALGDINSLHAIGQMFQIAGMKSSDANAIISHLATTNDPRLWLNAYTNATFGVMAKDFDKNFIEFLLRTGKVSEKASAKKMWNEAVKNGTFTPEMLDYMDVTSTQHKDLYFKFRQAMFDEIQGLVGGIRSGPDGLFVIDAFGKDISKLAEGDRAAATGALHRSFIYLPDFRDFRNQTYKLLKNMYHDDELAKLPADKVLANAFLKSGNFLNTWINENFFKPLALLTPGWALRVSMSELALNTARIGPLNQMASNLSNAYIRGTAGQIRTAQDVVDNEITRLNGVARDLRNQKTTEAETQQKLLDHNTELSARQKVLTNSTKRTNATLAKMEKKISNGETVDQQKYANTLAKRTANQKELSSIESTLETNKSKLDPNHDASQQGLEWAIVRHESDRDYLRNKKFIARPPVTYDQLVKEQSPEDIWQIAITPHLQLAISHLKDTIRSLRQEIALTSDVNANVALQHELAQALIKHQYFTGTLTARQFAKGPTADQLEKELTPEGIWNTAFRATPKTPKAESTATWLPNQKEANLARKALLINAGQDIDAMESHLQDEFSRLFGIQPPRQGVEQRVSAKTQKSRTQAVFGPPPITHFDIPRKIGESKLNYQDRLAQHAGGEYDWMKSLPESDLKRLEKYGWISKKREGGARPHDLENAHAHATGGSSIPYHEELMKMVDQWEAIQAIRKTKKFPNWADPSELELLRNTVKPGGHSFKLEDIYQDKSESINHLMGLKAHPDQVSNAKDFVDQALRNAYTDEGKPVWKMSVDEYKAHLTSLENEVGTILEKGNAGPLSAEDEARLMEIDKQQTDFEQHAFRDEHPTLEERHAFILRQARLSGEDVPITATDSHLSAEGPLGAPAGKYKGNFNVSKGVYENWAYNIQRDIDDTVMKIHDLTKRNRENMASIKDYKGDYSARKTYEENITLGIEERGYKLSPSTKEKIVMATYGVMAGASEGMLEAIGKEQFAHSAAFLIHQHIDQGTFQPHATDSREYIGSMFSQDVARQEQDVTKKSGALRTKEQLLFNPKFVETAATEKGYWAGYHYSANNYAADKLVLNPIARAYRDIYLRFPNDARLVHELAVTEAKKIIDNLPEHELATFDRHAIVAKGHESMDPHQSWAETAVSGLEGLVAREKQGAVQLVEGEAIRPVVTTYLPNADRLIGDIADDRLPSSLNQFHDFYGTGSNGKTYSIDELPEKVIARQASGNKNANILQKLSSQGHSKFLGPIVNTLSRDPLFVYEFVRARTALNEKILSGYITTDQADVMAQTTAAQRMVRYIHNPQDKTHFEDVMRIAAPFYFAQNQAWRRMGRLFADNPGAFLQYARAMYGVQQWVQHATNANGMSLFVFPTAALFGVPFTGSLSSLTTMDPLAAGADAGGPMNPQKTFFDALLPKFGPVVTVPYELAMSAGLNEWKPARQAAEYVSGPIASNQSIGQNMYQNFIPNSVAKNLFGGISGYLGLEAFPTNSFMTARTEAFIQISTEMQKDEWNRLQKQKMSDFDRRAAFVAWQAQNFGPNSSDQKAQQLLDKANNQAGMLWITKMVYGLFSPVSIGIGQAERNTRDKLKGYVNAKAFKGDYAKAVSQYIKDNPWATSVSITGSRSTKGNYLPETRQVYDYIDNNMNMVQKYPAAILAYGPTLSSKDKFYGPALQLEIANGLRERRVPEDFYKAFLVANGNAFYYNAIKPMYEKNRTATGVYKWKTDTLTKYGQNFNTDWFSSYNDKKSVTNKWAAVQSLKDLMKEDAYKNRPETGIYKNIIDTGLPELRKAVDQVQKGKATYQEVKDWWQAWLDSLKQDKSTSIATPGIDAVFYNLG